MSSTNGLTPLPPSPAQAELRQGEAPVYFPSVSRYIKSTNQGGVSHASQLAADKLAVAMQERFIHSDDTLPISVRWKPHVSCFFALSWNQIHGQTGSMRERGGHRTEPN